ncbi:hypothetical protein ES705_22160 [subsurface metagenome]
MSISMAIPTTEKNRPGPQRLKFPPWLLKLEPLPKRFFSRINPEAPICAGHLRIIRMKHKLFHSILQLTGLYRAVPGHSGRKRVCSHKHILSSLKIGPFDYAQDML